MNRLSLNVLIGIIIIGLGIAYAAIHINFVATHELAREHVAQQIALAEGMQPEAADLQSKVLFPIMLKIVFALIKKHSWSLFFAESITSIFSLWAFFMLSYILTGDKRYALFSTISISIFTPVAFQLVHRYGEILLIGFYALLLFFIITEKTLWYIFFLAVVSFQRPEIALSSVFFKIIHTIFIKRRYDKTFLDLSLFVIPLLTAYIIKQYYHMYSKDYLAIYFAMGFQRLFANLKAAPSVAMIYFPVIVLSVLLFRSFDKTIKMILISMIPYFVMVSLFGSYAESRLLLPIICILLIGIIKCLKDKAYLNENAA